MTEVKNMETMIATENQQEATEVMAFLGELEPQEKNHQVQRTHPRSSALPDYSHQRMFCCKSDPADHC